MQSVHRSLLLVAASLALLAGCDVGGSSSASTGAGAGGDATSGGNTGTVSPVTGKIPVSGGVGSANAGNTVVATASVGGIVSVATGANQTISITFNSSTGSAIAGFAISDTTLPDGWSGPLDLSCAVVSTGNGCVLNLTYAPTAVASGTLVVNYIFVDDAKVPRTPGGSVSIAYAATLHDNAVASVSPTGQITAGPATGNRSVSVNFTSDDGHALSDLAVATALDALPPGWSAMATSFACPIVSTGSGCQLALSYAPPATGSGTLVVDYGYTDDAGSARTGSLNIPYATTDIDNVIATVSPPGQVNAIQKTGGQSVAVTFTTDDGQTASGLSVISDLTSLAPGWRSASNRFACSSISTGNGCQLRLNYAPTTLAGGTLSLNYAYVDHLGSFKIGVVNVNYAATTDDNAVATASPTGQVNAVVGEGAQAVSVTFTTDDGRPATALQLTGDLTALPAGWSGATGAFACDGFSTGPACRLALMYMPTAASIGTLTLGYSYKNNAGRAKTGSINIAYRATTDDNVVGMPDQSSLAVLTGSNTVVQVAFTTDDGNPASNLTVTSGLAALPLDWSAAANSFACATVSVATPCRLSLSYAPLIAASGTLMLGFSYTNDSGVVKTGTTAIVYGATVPPP
jgi:hypothetical protein